MRSRTTFPEAFAVYFTANVLAGGNPANGLKYNSPFAGRVARAVMEALERGSRFDSLFQRLLRWALCEGVNEGSLQRDEFPLSESPLRGSGHWLASDRGGDWRGILQAALRAVRKAWSTTRWTSCEADQVITLALYLYVESTGEFPGPNLTVWDLVEETWKAFDRTVQGLPASGEVVEEPPEIETTGGSSE